MAMSIEYLKQKIKSVENILDNKDILVVLIIILTSFASFGLGRLSKIDESKTPISIENSASVYPYTANNKVNNVPDKKNNKQIYVASKNGTKYYFRWCSGANRIKQSNKVSFSSKEDAVKAGYTPAKNCKGL